jgi:gas vesicle protein
MTAADGTPAGGAAGASEAAGAAGGMGNVGEAQSPPDDPQALVEEIERTREELGNTVEALAAKMDVKARATERAAEVSDQVKERLTEAKQELTGKLGQVASGLTGKAAQTRRAVSDNGKTVLGAGQPAARELTGRAAAAGTTAWHGAPEPVQRGAQRAVRLVDENRVPAALIAAGTILVASWLVIYWRRQP